MSDASPSPTPPAPATDEAARQREIDLETRQTIRYLLGVFAATVVGCAGCVALSFYGGLATLKNHPSYANPVRQMSSDARAISLLGEPIEAELLGEDAKIERISDTEGRAEYTIPVRGSRRSGQLSVLTVMAQNVWKIERLNLSLDDSGQVIDLLSPAGSVFAPEENPEEFDKPAIPPTAP